MRRALAWSLAILLLSFATRVSAQCTSSLFPDRAGSAVGFVSVSPHITNSLLAAGTSYWTNACGNDGSAAPALLAGSEGDVTIRVYLQPGISTSNSGGCGVFNADVDAEGRVAGGTITLFDADILGHDCEPRHANTLAHEIGHVLGLGHSTCEGYIMSGSASRQVNPEECASVDAQWQTVHEDRIEQCNAHCATACNPDATCTGGQLTWNSGTDWFDPLVLDLDHNGITTTGSNDPVLFDLDADGTRELLSWINSDDAFLWADLNRNGRLDDGAELFGIGTTLPDGSKARDGFEALNVYDLIVRGGNGDGRIDADDPIWNRLRLWRDENHDGICDPGESAPIHRYGVRQLRLQWTSDQWMDVAGNLHLGRGTYLKHDGTAYEERLMESIAFRKFAGD